MLRATRKLQTAHTTRNIILHSLSYLTMSLIANSVDIETNPVPSQLKYPCQICEKAVTWSQRDTTTASNGTMQTANYFNGNLRKPTQCIMDMHKLRSPKFLLCPFQLLHNRLSHLVLTARSLNPKHQSRFPSCTLVFKEFYSYSKHNQRGSCLVTNFRSAKNKIPLIENIIDTSEPTIILGNETWLNRNIASSKIFPSNFTVHRRDREDG